jgi:hypothetical protein
MNYIGIFDGLATKHGMDAYTCIMEAVGRNGEKIAIIGEQSF